MILLGCSNLGNWFIYCMLHSGQTLTRRFLGMGSEAIGKHWTCMNMLGSNRADFRVKFHESMWAPHLILFLKGLSDGDLAEAPSIEFINVFLSLHFQIIHWWVILCVTQTQASLSTTSWLALGGSMCSPLACIRILPYHQRASIVIHENALIL